MSERFEAVEELLFADPLGETTRRERRNLLATSMLAIAVVQGRLIPTRIMMADIEANADNQRFLFRFAALIVTYLLIAFTVYFWSEYRLWRFKLSLARYERSYAALEGLRRAVIDTGSAPVAESLPVPKLPSPKWAQTNFVLRLTIDLIVPIAVGVYALVVLLTATPIQVLLASYPIWTVPH